jgi:outer membrane protein OmpA-like peptidoglycan-associated protein
MPTLRQILGGLAGGAAALAIVATAPVPAIAQSATDEINRIINELAPARGASAERPGYRDRVRQVKVIVRPNIASETAYRQNAIIEERSYVLNYNHTEDFTVHFAFDSFALTPKARDVLDVVGAALTDPRLAGETYLVGGHTDTAGPADYNQWLSEKRAWAVTAYLVDAWGVAPDRLKPVGFGEQDLADPRRGANVRNRRVEFTLVETRPGSGPTAYAPPAADPPAYTPPAGTAPQAGLPADGNVVCDTAPVALNDPRAPRHNLDDFGSPRTPVACEDVHTAAPAAPAAPATGNGSGSAIDQTNAAIGN